MRQIRRLAVAMSLLLFVMITAFQSADNRTVTTDQLDSAGLTSAIPIVHVVGDTSFMADSVYFDLHDPEIVPIDSIVNYYDKFTFKRTAQAVFFKDHIELWRQYYRIENYTYRIRWSDFMAAYDEEDFRREESRIKAKWDKERYKQEGDEYAMWSYFMSWLRNNGYKPISYKQYLLEIMRVEEENYYKYEELKSTWESIPPWIFKSLVLIFIVIGVIRTVIGLRKLLK